MNTIYLLKQIIDLIYEEYKYHNTLSDDSLYKLKELEKQLEDKNKEVARLYTENIKLENTVRQFEADFELASNIWGEPHIHVPNEPNNITNIQSNVPHQPDTNQYTTSSKKKTKPKMATQLNTIEVKTDNLNNQVKVELIPEEQVNITMENNVDTDKPVKKNRRHYMREYQREYRKKQREQKISMTL
jgi:hypothetical protein